jgi:hypothetical protein
MGIDVQVLSPTDCFYMYDADTATTGAVARDCNTAIMKSGR